MREPSSAESTVGSELPFVTVIIPMRNEIDWIDRCIGSVLGQDYPADRMEVIVADGESDDGTRERLAEIAAEDSRLKVVNNPHRIVPGGINLALAEARGDIITRVDGHTVLEADYVRTGVEILERTGAWNVGGPMVCNGGGPVGNAIAAAMGSRFGIGAYFHFAEEEAEADTAYMGMWPRHVFETVGLFDEELVRNQDDEHSYRIRKAGGKIIVAPAMRSHYQNRESWTALRRQFYQYGVWKVRVLQKHPAQMSIRHFVPPAYQVGVLGLTALALATGWWLAALGATFGVLAYLGILFGVAMAGQGDLPARLRLFRGLVTIHQCWAWGFLVGSVRFAPRWIRKEPDAGRLPARSGRAAAASA